MKEKKTNGPKDQLSKQSYFRAWHIPLPDSPRPVKLTIRHVDLGKIFFQIITSIEKSKRLGKWIFLSCVVPMTFFYWPWTSKPMLFYEHWKHKEAMNKHIYTYMKHFKAKYMRDMWAAIMTQKKKIRNSSNMRKAKVTTELHCKTTIHCTCITKC